MFGPAGTIPRVDALSHNKLTVTMNEIDQAVLPVGVLIIVVLTPCVIAVAARLGKLLLERKKRNPKGAGARTERHNNLSNCVERQGESVA